MKLKGIHFLLTYLCNFECDHCFLYCSPTTNGVFTAQRIRGVLDEAMKLDSIKEVYFEGGEPFLYYPILLDGIRAARERNLEVGIVTNAYWATTIEDALLWLEPLKQLGVGSISLSDDFYHYGNVADTPPKNALSAAQRLGLVSDYICIEQPMIQTRSDKDGTPGDPVVGGGAVFRGRAVEKLTEGLPVKNRNEMTACLQEKLDEPSRVHLDPFGHVHICQGLSIGNAFESSFSDIMKNYRPLEHPICGPLLEGGPLKLAMEHDIHGAEGYVDECHFCYLSRKSLIAEYPQYLTPEQIYGIETRSVS